MHSANPNLKELKSSLHQKKHKRRAKYFDAEHDENPFGIYQSYDIYHDPSIPVRDPSAWAGGAGARQMGWSPEVNPWTAPRNNDSPDHALSKGASGYTSLHDKKRRHHRRGGGRDIAETHIDPWVYDKVDPNVEWAALQPRKPEPKVDRYWIDNYKPAENPLPSELHPSKFYIDGSSPTDTYYDESIP